MGTAGRWLALGLVAIGSWILAPADALACQCVTSPTPLTPAQVRDQLKDDLTRAHAVFIGEPVARTSLSVRLRVEAVWKGDLGTEVVMATGGIANSDGTLTISSCDASLSLGMKYLVFGYGRSNETMVAGVCGFTGTIGPSTPLASLDSIVPRRPPSSLVPRPLVGVTGVVRNPGLFEWTPGTTVDDLVARAGGAVRPPPSPHSRFTAESRLMRHVDGTLTRIAVSRGTTVLPNDELIVGIDLVRADDRWKVRSHVRVPLATSWLLWLSARAGMIAV